MSSLRLQRLATVAASTAQRCQCVLRLWCCIWFAACGLPAGAATPSPSPLQLSQRAGPVDAWPAVTVLSDAMASMTFADAVARMNEFHVADAPRANLGKQPGATWLRVPVMVAQGEDDHWVMQINSPQLELVDIYLLQERAAIAHFTLSNATPFAQRLFPTRAHTVAFKLQPGLPYEVLMRVQATQTIVPITFYTPMDFQAAESREQIIQGLVTGIELCLFIYCMAQWLILRDAAFVYYALHVLGTTALFATYFGTGAQHIWPDTGWLSTHMVVLSTLIGTCGVAGFTERALGVSKFSRLLSWGLAALTAECIVTGSLYVLDFLSYEVASVVTCANGPILMVLSASAAVVRVRSGDRAAAFILCGWVLFSMGLTLFLGMYQGFFPATYWTDHSMQIGTLLERSMWVMVLAMRVEHIRTAARQTQAERDRLHSLAHTDALTGLPNRRGLGHVLGPAVAAATAERATAVYLLDLDGFKPINDRLGHDAGDELLVAVAARLRGLVRSSDTVSRLGGDEFVIVASQLPGDTEALRLGHKLLEGIRMPFHVAGQTCYVGLTIGYALAPLDGRHDNDLIKLADAAMYAGKQAGRNCIRRAMAAGTAAPAAPPGALPLTNAADHLA